jgi:serine protease Do
MAESLSRRVEEPSDQRAGGPQRRPTSRFARQFGGSALATRSCPTLLRFAAAAVILTFAVAPLRGQEPSGLDAAAAIESALVQTIAAAEKSVVAVARVRKEQNSDSVRLEVRPDAFGRKLSIGTPPQPTDPSFVPNEYGTGVVVDRRGLILTACHVLGEENDNYYVTTFDRHVYRAWIKAADPRSDLAVLSIDGADLASASLTPIRLGDADRLRKGQIVITLGNPYAIARDGQPSAGWGIVANLGRKAPPLPDNVDATGKTTLYHYGGLIQTDARLHLGTSGGPLLNLRGEMVGLCVSQAATAGYESQAGYAIPVDSTFVRVLDSLKQGREAEYGFLGIRPANLDPAELAAGLQGIRGRIEAGTPAARSGLREQDIITSVNGSPVYDSDSLVLQVGRLPVEAVAHLGIVRNGARQTIDVVLSKYPVRGRKVVTVRPEAWRGVRVDYASAYIEPDPLQPLGSRMTDEAVVVTEVDPNTPAAQVGMKPGMLISRVDGQPVRTPKEFQAAVGEKAGGVQLRLLASDPSNALLTVPPGG